MDTKQIAFDCKGKEIQVGSKVIGAMSEVAIMGINGTVEEIQFDKHNEAYGKISGYEGYWHLRQFVKIGERK